MEIKLNNKNYSLKFGLGFFRELGRIYGDDTMQQTLTRIVAFDQAETVDQLPYSLLDLLENIVLAAAKNEKSNDFDKDDFQDVLEAVMTNSNFIAEFKQAILETMPKHKDTELGKQKAQKKTSAKQ